MRPAVSYIRISLAAAAVSLLAAIQGCSLVREDWLYDSVVEPESKFYMTVSVITSMSSSTRADGGDIHVDDKQEPGSDAENYIDFANNDFMIALFDSNGDYLLSMDAMNNWTEFPHPSGSSSGGQYAVYKMEREIEFPESISKEKIEAIKKSGFQVLVLANWKNAQGVTGKGYEDFPKDAAGTPQKLDDIWKDGTNYNFKYNYAGVKPEGQEGYTGYVAWQPEHKGNVKKLIPMFGYVKGQKFEPGNGGEFRSESTIHMQRAVAKIEVLDNLTNQPALEVSNVTMTKFNTVGRFIPDVLENPDWDTVKTQVGKSSLPDESKQQQRIEPLQFIHIEAAGERGKWIAYVPEMDLTLSGLSLDAQKRFDPESATARPHLEVEINPKKGETIESYTGGTYDAHFARYDQVDFKPTIPDESWNHILRNHIYRFSVNKVGLTVDLHLHVTPWDLETDEEWDFTDHVTISQALTWEEGTYDFLVIDGKRYGDDASDEGDTPGGETDDGYKGDPSKDNEVYLKLDRTVLEGTFKIATPRNGWWYARLTPVDGANPNSVSFVDKDGNPLPGDGMNISGQIDGNEQKLYIRQSTSDNEQESRFKLEFWVENLGVWMSVPMPDGPYTIVRQGNLIQ